MHELAVTQRILDIALRHAESEQADRITDIYLVIGQLSSIVDDSVQFYWDFISDKTIAKGAKLHFRRIPTLFECKRCAFQYSPNGIQLDCPNCGSESITVVAGEEFYLEAIDIENGAESNPH